jgi:predicted unusual protein kinase regulating ubiquinone biosynthesis (AarF/ABC1/UbiB family)
VSFEKDNKCKLSDRFTSFDPVAIGAASLAQVHKATLKTGEVVAVKLQYPTLRVQMKIDLFVLRQLTKWANYLAKRWEYKGFNFTKYLAHFE